MRLINTTTLELEEFIGDATPKYAILSHTWEDREVSLQDFCSFGQWACFGKKGFAKIKQTCRLAKEDGLGYAWVDTCCIDKTSSAELSEAINSMFRWYKDAAACYVYLSDLDDCTRDDPETFSSRLKACRWFTRGWTLQELIAPKTMVFYDAKWASLGTKIELNEFLEGVVQIHPGVLSDSSMLKKTSVAQKMSWAAARKTTRPEDMAYCLLGIFDVHMPLLYGEGARKAFLRLQDEIIRVNNDMSILAWRTPQIPGRLYTGILADSPASFAESGDIFVSNSFQVDNGEFTMTNKGLKLEQLICMAETGYYLLPLMCSRPYGGNRPLAIVLRKQSWDLFLRAKYWQPLQASAFRANRRTPRPYYLLRSMDTELAMILRPAHRNGIIFRKGFSEKQEPDIHVNPDIHKLEPNLAAKKYARWTALPPWDQYSGSGVSGTNFDPARRLMITSDSPKSYAITLEVRFTGDDPKRGQSVRLLVYLCLQDSAWSLAFKKGPLSEKRELSPTAEIVMEDDEDEFVSDDLYVARRISIAVRATKDRMDGEPVVYVDVESVSVSFLDYFTGSHGIRLFGSPFVPS